MFIKFAVLITIIGIKAFFSAADTAFTYLNKAKFNQMSKHVKKTRDRKIVKIKSMLDNKLKLFGTTKIGITLAELFASAFAAEAFVWILAEKFQSLGINSSWQYIFSIIIVTIILSYFTLVFGEIIPKRIARNKPEKVAYRTINILSFFASVNMIFEKILGASENFFSSLLGIKDEPEEKLTERELKMIIAEGKDQGMFDTYEKNLLYNALKFDDFKIKQIMKPKEEITYINIADDMEKIRKAIRKSKFTRLPVYEKSKDNIIGILHVKDILIKETNNIKDILREPLYINKDERIDNVFRTMQLNNKHMAIVKNAGEKVEGIITMEDILEKLVGNIIDEHDK